MQTLSMGGMHIPYKSSQPSYIDAATTPNNTTNLCASIITLCRRGTAAPLHRGSPYFDAEEMTPLNLMFLPANTVSKNDAHKRINGLS
jgi:hypothetical protein